MIIKGKSRAGPQQLAKHLGNAEKNEKVQLLETKGTVARDLPGALLEMDAYAAGTKCEKPLYHAAISPEPPHLLTPEQRAEAIDALEVRLGFAGRSRVVVLHEKLGRQHIHVVWSRIDLDRMSAVSDSHNYRKHEEVARDLERRFGHDRVQGAHHERDGVKRPDRTPSRAELQQQERTGITGKMVKDEVTAAFRASDGPEAFRAALEEKGYILARGDRRDHVVIDPLGGVHSLARRTEGMKVAELRAYMAPIDTASLPSVEEAREIAADRVNRAREWLASHGEALSEKAYTRGDDYVSQTQAALKDIQHHREQRRKDVMPQRPLHETKRDELAAAEKEQAGKERAEKERAERGERHRPPPKAPEMGDYSPPVKDREPNRYRDFEAPEVDRERTEKAPDGGDPTTEKAPEMGDYSSPTKSREPNRYAALDNKAAKAIPEARPIEIDPDMLRYQEILDESDRERRKAAEEVTGRREPAADKDRSADNVEMTEARRERMERMLNSDADERAHSSERDDLEPDRQHEAPGGGRTRSQ